jgi:hypothetical protein
VWCDVIPAFYTLKTERGGVRDIGREEPIRQFAARMTGHYRVSKIAGLRHIQRLPLRE